MSIFNVQKSISNINFQYSMSILFVFDSLMVKICRFSSFGVDPPGGHRCCGAVVRVPLVRAYSKYIMFVVVGFVVVGVVVVTLTRPATEVTATIY